MPERAPLARLQVLDRQAGVGEPASAVAQLRLRVLRVGDAALRAPAAARMTSKYPSPVTRMDAP